MNGQHIRKLSEGDYLQRISQHAASLSGPFSEARWKRLVLLYRSRIRTWEDLREQASYCFSDPETYDPSLRQQYLQNRVLKRHLEAWSEKVSEMGTFDCSEEIERVTRETATGWGIEAKDLIHPIRFALTGKTMTPGLFELMSVIGKEKCLSRMKRFLTSDH